MVSIPNLSSVHSEDHLNFPSMALGPGEKSKTSGETHWS
jgi:hypothetical protein